jgi:O-antigen/teichoic acid export membrane protein
MAFIGLPQSIRDWSGLPFGGNSVSRREVWQFGAPLAISFALGAAGAFAGRYVVVALEGAALLGVYVLCNEIATRIATLSLSPIGAASASITFFELREKGQAAVRDRLRHTCLLMLGLVMPGATGLAIVSPDIAATLVGTDFRVDTALILPIIGFAIFAQRFRGEYLDQALHLGLRSDRLLWASIVTLVVSLVGNYVLVSEFGLIGAAYTALLVSLIGIIIVAIMGRAAFPLPFPPVDVFKIGISSLVMAAAVLALPFDPGFFGLFARMTTGCLVYLVSLVILDVGQLRVFIRKNVSILP